MQKKTKSLLEALNDVVKNTDREALIETRATHVIDSAINLINLIRETYDQHAAHDLERRLLLSIQGGDSAKFARGIRNLRDDPDMAKKRPKK